MLPLISPRELDLALRNAIASPIQNLDAYVPRPGKDFSRDRKLDITTMATTIITMGEHAIRDELIDNPSKHVKKLLKPVLRIHRPRFNPPKCTVRSRLAATTSAFTQKRKLLSPRFFEDAFYEFIRLTHRGTFTFKGLKVLAVDGSDVRIPPNPKDPDYYIQKSDGSAPYNQLHLDVIYDVLERTFVAASTRGKNKTDEREVAITLMQKCNIAKAILTADRGYESYNFLAHTQEKGWFYLIRAKDIDSNGIPAGLPIPREEEFDVLFDLTLTNKDTTDVRQLE